MIRLSRLSSLVLCAILLVLSLAFNPVLGQDQVAPVNQENPVSPVQPGDDPEQVTPPGEIDTSSLSLPAVEVRSVVPYGKDDARFGKVTAPPEDIRFPPSTPIQVRLLASKAPRVNEAINISFEIYAAREAAGIEARLELPEGVMVLSGAPTAQLDLAAEQRAEVKASIVFTKPGEYSITGRALKKVDANMVWGDMDSLFFTVGEDAGFVGFESGEKTMLAAAQLSPDTPNMDMPIPEIEDNSRPDAYALEEESAMEAPPVLDQPTEDRLEAPPEGVEESPDSAAPEVTVSVNVCWVLGSDRDGSKPPLRDAYIQLWDQDSGADDLLAATYTHYWNGCTSIAVSNTDADECCTIDVYYKVYLYHGGRYRVTNYGNGIYTAQTSTQWNLTASHNFGTWWLGGSSGNDRSVRIYNDLYRARRFLKDQAVDFGMGGYPGEVWVLWQTGGTDGTYYSLGDQKVHLDDNDSASRDTVVHEANHSYMDDIYSSWPPWDCPSPHYIQYTGGCGCGLSEGWTYMIVAAADGNPVYTWPSGSSLNLEEPKCNSSGWDDGPKVEGRVGGVLIDLMDIIWLDFEGPVTGFRYFEWHSCGKDRAVGLFDAAWNLFYDQDDQVFTTCTQGTTTYTNSFSNAWQAYQYPEHEAEDIGDLNSITNFMQD